MRVETQLRCICSAVAESNRVSDTTEHFGNHLETSTKRLEVSLQHHGQLRGRLLNQ